MQRRNDAHTHASVHVHHARSSYRAERSFEVIIIQRNLYDVSGIRTGKEPRATLSRVAPSSDAQRMSDSAGGSSDEPASTLIGSLVAAFKERLAGGSKR